jgi:glycosyltransferase involved in cell wall biosynthesis
MAAETAIVSDVWYGEHLGATLIDGPSWRRSLDLWRAGGPHALIVTQLGRPVWPLVALEAIRGRRRLILTQLMRSRPVQWHHRLAFRLRLFVFRQLLRRTVAAAHVLSSWERDECARLLGIPRDRIRFIPLPLMPVDPGPADRGGYVVSSGRAACDWETLFQAAAGSDWPLVVVCSKHDAARVAKLNRSGRATVHVDIPREEHQRLVAHASVYVAALAEITVSSGQVRVMDAHRVLTPVVATNVRGLSDYLVPNESALVVEPGDAAALRDAVNRLLSDRRLAQTLAMQAVRIFEPRTIEGYIAGVQDLVASVREENYA